MSELGLNSTQIKRFLGYLKVANSIQLAFLSSAIMAEQKQRRKLYSMEKYKR